MKLMERFQGLAAKLYLIVAIAAVALAVLLGAALIGSERMAGAARNVHAVGLVGIERAVTIQALFERYRGLVSRVPGEMDLERQAQFKQLAESTLAEIRAALAGQESGASNAEASTVVAELTSNVDAIERTGGEVFAFSADFAQDQANDVLSGRFAELEAALSQNVAAVLNTERANAEKEIGALEEARQAMLTASVVISVLALLLAGGVGVAVARNISRRVGRLSSAMESLAEDKTDIDIPSTADKDELGIVARSLEILRDGMVEKHQLERQAARAQGHRLEVAEAKEGKTREFEQSVGTVIMSLTSAADQLTSTSNSLVETTVDMTDRSTAVAAASTQASANVQQVAGSAQELSKSIQGVSSGVIKTTEIAQAAVQEANVATSRIRGLAEASQRIGEVVGLINDIASQTNLLALNATIEAARSGEAGKGFAVVASEVKNLANQTASATEDISEQVAGIQAEMTEAVRAIEGISETIDEMNDIASNVSSAVRRQTTATEEIGRNVSEAAKGTRDVDRNIAQVADGSDRTGSAAKETQSATNAMTTELSRLRQQIDGFLADMRDLDTAQDDDTVATA